MALRTVLKARVIFPGWNQSQLPGAPSFSGLCLWSGQNSASEAFRPYEEQKAHKNAHALGGVLVSKSGGGKRWTGVILQSSVLRA